MKYQDIRKEIMQTLTRVIHEGNNIGSPIFNNYVLNFKWCYKISFDVIPKNQGFIITSFGKYK